MRASLQRIGARSVVRVASPWFGQQLARSTDIFVVRSREPPAERVVERVIRRALLHEPPVADDQGLTGQRIRLE
jgi:hypothetical protein